MSTLATGSTPTNFAVERKRLRLLGLTADDAIRAFFGGNAIVAVIILALITVFLFREGFGFFAENLQNLQVYRQAGLEYVDIIRREETGHTALTRELADIRQRALEYQIREQHLPVAAANQQLAGFDEFAGQVGDAIEPVRGLVSDLTDEVTVIKTKFSVSQDQREHQRQLLAEGKRTEAETVKIEQVDFATEIQPLLATRPQFREASAQFVQHLEQALERAPALPTPALRGRMADFVHDAREYLAGLPQIERDLEAWDWRKPVPVWRAFTSFAAGRQWLTASFWQDWFGVLPLLIGSLLVSGIALVLAVPLGVGAAIYVNQLASRREQRLIKPCIEFISAFPSVVLGFFGIVFLGEHLRQLSQLPWLSWVPGFPIAERLNALTAGCLLALLAVPTIFTLAEDALNNVPRSFREASLALGATRLQTIIRITVPAALSGIISAVLLGFGRVIGETMVVLLCAGNRIAIPDFTAGLGVVTQPVHTMTGIIAQEMGEVVRGSIHYRALFVVGLALFLLSLLINYVAQKIVRRYRFSIG
jgi:phosphate transport system permease protein